MTYHFDYIKRLTDEDLVAHIAFVRSDDKTEREQACFQDEPVRYPRLSPRSSP